MSEVKFTDMVNALAKNGQELIDGLTPESAHCLHMAVGVMGEVGELIENCLENGSRKNKVEEFGDIEFYFQGNMINCDNDLFLVIPESVCVSTNKQLLKLTVAAAAALDAAKKFAVYCNPLDKKEFTNQMVLVRSLVDYLYITYDISKEESIESNKHKLLTSDKARYKLGKFTNEQAQIRADKL